MVTGRHFGVFLLFLNVGLSLAGDDLLGIKININPVVDLIRGREKATVATTTEATTISYSNINNRFEEMRMKKVKCGQRQLYHTGLITGGQSTKPGDWPWHVAIYKLKTSNANQQYICGGTLLSKTLVITAGHCVMENGAVVTPERIFAIVGKYNLAGGDMASQERGVFQILTHPDFSHSTLSNDLALLKLLSEVTYSMYVQPICLWNDDTSKTKIIDELGTVVGWGFTESDTQATELLMAKMPVRGDMECVKSDALFYSRHLSETTFCAGFANGTGACNGDSGGGMYFSRQNDDGEMAWYLRGIVSLAKSRPDRNICDSNHYIIFTDAAQYLNFIKHH